MRCLNTKRCTMGYTVDRILNKISNLKFALSRVLGLVLLVTCSFATTVHAQTANDDTGVVVNYDVIGNVNVLANDTPSGGNNLDPDSVLFPALGQPAGSTIGTDTSGNPTLTVPNEGTYTALTNGTIDFEGLASFAGRTSAITYEVFETPSGNSDTATLDLIMNERGVCVPDDPTDPGVVIGTPGGLSPDFYVFPLNENPSPAELIFNHNTVVDDQNSDADATNDIPDPLNGLDTNSLTIINSMGLDSVHNVIFYTSNSGEDSNLSVFYYAGDQPRSSAANAPLGRIGVLISNVENITECAIPANCPNIITGAGRGLNDAAGEFFGGSHFLGVENSDGANLDRMYRLDIDVNVFPPVLEAVTLVREFDFGNENAGPLNHDWGDVVIDPSTLTMFDIDRGEGETDFEIHTLDMSTIPFTHVSSCTTGSVQSTTGQSVITHNNRIFMLTGNGAQFREVTNPTTCTLGPLSDIGGVWPAQAAADGSSCADPNAFRVVDRDFGDAPDTYGTLLSSTGPSHVITTQVGLVRYIRLMKSGTNTGGDYINLSEIQVIDIDGVNRALTGTASQSSNFNGLSTADNCIDGDTSKTGTDTCHTLNSTTNEWWQVDLGANFNVSEIRIFNRDDCCENRLSNMYVLAADTAFPGTTVLADSLSNADFQLQLGEVVAADPDRTVTGTTPILNIGSLVDAETNGQPSTDAEDDDNTGTSDEGGVAFTSPGGNDHAELFANVTVNNDTGSDAFVCAWLDRWDNTGLGDGFFDLTDFQDAAAGPRCQTVANGGGTVEFHWSGLEQVSGNTFFRTRVCNTDGECDSPGGTADSGEVEDYQIFFDFTPTAVSIGEVNLETRDVDEFLAEIDVDSMNSIQLLSILSFWNPELANQLEGQSRELILQALREFLDPDGDGEVALFRWVTIQERGTIGFYASRKISDGQWIRVNKNLLPSLVSPLGGEYILADPAVTSGNNYQYRLIELEGKGTTRTYGPYDLTLP